MKNIQITVELAPEESMLQKIREQLRAFNEAKIGVSKAKTFAVMAHHADGTFVGGMFGWLQWGWLFVHLAWVDEGARGQGIGSQLLQRFEALAKEQGITRARLNTASFQGGLAFYKRCGYETYAELDIESPDGEKHVDYFMKKSLRDAS